MEEWRSIKGFEGSYEVSDLGRVRSLDRMVNSAHNAKRIVLGQILRASKEPNGYLRICLSIRNRYKSYSVHRLVAKAFIPNCDNKSQINHKDGDKENNTVPNLEWCTAKENSQHAVTTGLRVNTQRGSTHYGSILTESDVLTIRFLKAEGMPPKHIAEIFDIKSSHLSAIISKRIWKHV